MKFPVTMRALRSGIVVEFSDKNSGTILDKGTTPNPIGAFRTDWISSTDKSVWEPYTNPKKLKLLNMIKDFR